MLAREGIVAAPQPEELSRAEGSGGQLDGEGDAAADVNMLLRLVARLGGGRRCGSADLGGAWRSA